MRVLLISPLPKIDPACGDVTYTEILLTHPPEGIIYETYTEALSRGALREHGTGRALKEALTKRSSIWSELLLTIASKSVTFLRRRRLLFWEPFRFFSVRQGEYDLIHLHVFSARFFNLTCPLVVSNAAPQRFVYTQARHYSKVRVAFIEKMEVVLGKLLKVNVNSYSLPQAIKFIAFTEFLKTWYIGQGIMAVDQIDVIPIFLPNMPRTQPSSPIQRVGFIAKDFEAKGGPTLLRAFEQVRKERKDVELYIIGCQPQLSKADMVSQGIIWMPYIARELLITEILPSFDVFAYPTQFDGLPLVVLEAMALGTPIATSDYQAMPEIIGHGQAGLISSVGDSCALAQNILNLLEPETNAFFRANTLKWFDQTYSSSAVRPLLLASYCEAIKSCASLSTTQ